MPFFITDFFRSHTPLDVFTQTFLNVHHTLTCICVPVSRIWVDVYGYVWPCVCVRWLFMFVSECLPPGDIKHIVVCYFYDISHLIYFTHFSLFYLYALQAFPLPQPSSNLSAFLISFKWLSVTKYYYQIIKIKNVCMYIALYVLWSYYVWGKRKINFLCKRRRNDW